MQTEILTHVTRLGTRLGTSRLYALHESKFPFVSRIEFIRSKLSNFLLMYPGSVFLPLITEGVTDCRRP